MENNNISPVVIDTPKPSKKNLYILFGLLSLLIIGIIVLIIGYLIKSKSPDIKSNENTSYTSLPVTTTPAETPWKYYINSDFNFKFYLPADYTIETGEFSIDCQTALKNVLKPDCALTNRSQKVKYLTINFGNTISGGYITIEPTNGDIKPIVCYDDEIKSNFRAMFLNNSLYFDTCLNKKTGGFRSDTLQGINISNSEYKNLQLTINIHDKESGEKLTKIMNSIKYPDVPAKLQSYTSPTFGFTLQYPEDLVVTERECYSPNGQNKTKELLIGEAGITRNGVFGIAAAESIYFHYGNCETREKTCNKNSSVVIDNKTYNAFECVKTDESQQNHFITEKVTSGKYAKYPNFDIEVFSYDPERYMTLKDIIKTIKIN